MVSFTLEFLQTLTCIYSPSLMRLVPTIDIDGHRLTESLAIIEYLEETRPDVPLLPRGFAARAKVRQLALMIACDIQPVQNLRYL